MSELGEAATYPPIDEVTQIPLDEGGLALVGEVVLESGAMRRTLSLCPETPFLTNHDCAVIAGELLRRSHAPTLPSGSGDKT